jgi:hypothetical protein
MGFVVDKVVLGQVFSEYFGFTCKSSFHQSSIIWGWYNRPVLAAVPSVLSLTPLRIIIEIIIPLFMRYEYMKMKKMRLNSVRCRDSSKSRRLDDEKLLRTIGAPRETIQRKIVLTVLGSRPQEDMKSQSFVK